MTEAAKRALTRGDEFPYDDADYMADKTPKPTKPKDWAHRAARGVLADLTDRRGVRHELEAIDDDVRVELVASLADIIREAHVKATRDRNSTFP